MSSNPPIVCTKDIYKYYRAGDAQVTALSGVSLEFQQGDFVSIMGPSGGGKTTFLNCLGGLDLPDRGEIYFKNRLLNKMSDNELTELRRREIGFVFQFHHLLPEFTALENVAMPLRIAQLPASEANQRAETLLREVGLGDRIVHRPSMLSGGEQQRVAVARALVMRPSLLLADEPTGDLDEQTGGELQALIRRMHRDHQLTSLIATHNLQLANSCDRILRLEEGVLRMV